MTDAEHLAAGIGHLKKTTVGYINKRWTTPPAGSEWKMALDEFAQIGVVVPPPPPPTNAYFVSDWSSGQIAYVANDKTKPWATIFTYTTSQDVGLYGSPPLQSSADGRVSVVPNPYGSGNVCRCEIRDADPDRPLGSLIQKAELGSYEPKTWAGGSWVNGAELWIEMEIYLPDEFGLASGGSNSFTNIADLHPSSNSGVPGLALGGYSQTNIQFYSGVPGFVVRKDFIPVIPANRNRKLLIHIGAKIATSGGWVEAWLDGVNVVPRFNQTTAEASESGPYWKQGLYKYKDAVTPGGRTILYMGATSLYTSRPF